jgi:hypothetical protein
MDIPPRQGPRFISAQEPDNYVGRQTQQPSRVHYVRTPGNVEGSGESRIRLPSMENFISTFEDDVAFIDLLLNDIYRFQDPQMEQFRMAIGRVKFALLMMKDEWRRFLDSDKVESESEPRTRLDALFSHRAVATNATSPVSSNLHLGYFFPNCLTIDRLTAGGCSADFLRHDRATREMSIPSLATAAPSPVVWSPRTPSKMAPHEGFLNSNSIRLVTISKECEQRAKQQVVYGTERSGSSSSSLQSGR